MKNDEKQTRYSEIEYFLEYLYKCRVRLPTAECESAIYLNLYLYIPSSYIPQNTAR